ncbi:MAG: hypothetical protein AB1425_08880 [Actinomycetota bacterium]
MIGDDTQRDGTPPESEFRADVRVVRAMYRALEEGDEVLLMRSIDAGIRWVHPLVTRLPFDGARCGLRAVLCAAFRLDESGDGPRVCAGSFLELGDGVLVVGRFLGGGADEAGEPFLHECYVRGGRVVLIREYPALS